MSSLARLFHAHHMTSMTRRRDTLLRKAIRESRAAKSPARCHHQYLVLSSLSSAFASFKSAVSKPWMNQL
jgi:hypothetical protein